MRGWEGALLATARSSRSTLIASQRDQGIVRASIRRSRAISRSASAARIPLPLHARPAARCSSARSCACSGRMPGRRQRHRPGPVWPVRHAGLHRHRRVRADRPLGEWGTALRDPHIGNIALDVNLVEKVDINPLEGADRVFAHSLEGPTSMPSTSTLSVRATKAISTPDTVTLDGTDQVDTVLVGGSRGEATVVYSAIPLPAWTSQLPTRHSTS